MKCTYQAAEDARALLEDRLCLGRQLRCIRAPHLLPRMFKSVRHLIRYLIRLRYLIQYRDKSIRHLIRCMMRFRDKSILYLIRYQKVRTVFDRVLRSPCYMRYGIKVHTIFDTVSRYSIRRGNLRQSLPSQLRCIRAPLLRPRPLFRRHCIWQPSHRALFLGSLRKHVLVLHAAGCRPSLARAPPPPTPRLPLSRPLGGGS